MRGNIKRLWVIATAVLLVGSMAVAQDSADEDSLLAMEEMTLTDAVEGDLPVDDAGDDDLLAELLAGSEESEEVIEALPAEDEIPLDELPLDDSVAEDFGAALTELPAEDLTDTIEGIEASPDALEMDDSGADLSDLAEATDETEAVGEEEPLDLGAAIEELGLPSDEPAEETAAVTAEPPSDDLLGELTGDEPVGEEVPTEEAPITDLVEDLAAGEDFPEEEKGVDDPSADDMDDLLGELAEEDAPEVAEEPPVDDMADLLGDLAGEETPEMADPPASEVDDLLGALEAEEPPASLPDAAEAEEDLDDLIGELAGEPEEDLPAGVLAEVPEVIEEPEVADLPLLAEETELPTEEPPAVVDIVDEPPADEYVDDMALEDALFDELAGEAKGDMAAGQAALARDAGLQPVAELPPPAPDVVEALVAEAESEMGIAAPVTVPAEVPVPVTVPTVEPAPVVVAPPPPPPMTEKDRQIAAFETAERLKRIAAEAHAIESIRNAEEELAKRGYLRAIVLYEEALEHLPRRDDLAAARQRARDGLGGAYYLRAISLERMGELEKAKAAALNAVKFGYGKGEAAVKRIQARIDVPPPPPPPIPKDHWEMPDYVKRQKEIGEWLKRGRQAYLAGDYEEGILAFESVLARDPENKEAIRLMRSAAQKKYDRSSAELQATRTRMMSEVRDTWNPRQYGLHEAPIDAKIGIQTETSVENVERTRILSKMEKIRIPEVDFRQANIRDVVDFLHSQSVEFDPEEDPDQRKGVNIILKLDQEAGGAAAAPAAPLDPFAAPADAFGDAGGGGAAGGEILVTFSAIDITLKEALDIVVDVAGLKYRIRGSVVIILPKNAPEGDIEHRMYDVLSTAVERFRVLSDAASSTRRGGGGGDFMALEGGADLGGEELDLKALFSEFGVEWPDNSSIKYVQGLGKLVVANTLENLTVFEKVLSILNVVPYQIEIEARFVEVAQTDVDSLGLEWLLNDDWELAHKKNGAGAPLAAQQRIVVNGNANSGGFTKGNRFMNTTGIGGGTMIADDLLTLSAVLTNPELSVVLHALQQRGHTDLLSAPKITTQSGQQATIKVVTEYIYPTEFETQGISGGDNNNVNNQSQQGGVVGAVVTPSAFETREVGVILEVMPEVSPEGQMINLTLSPEVVSEPEWRNYGSQYTSYDPNGNPVTQNLNMEQPFFHTRSLRTNLLIYNGATVVMGGMITEVRKDVDDKVPLLGDIPIVGRLFRSRYESSEKRNLLIFVTARLVDPAGRALDSSRFGVDQSIATRLVEDDAGAGE
jgi:general secretion pathway protein D